LASTTSQPEPRKVVDALTFVGMTRTAPSVCQSFGRLI
jgi:hypothetical protein